MIRRSEAFLRQLVILVDGLVLVSAFFATYAFGHWIRTRYNVQTPFDVDAPPVPGVLLMPMAHFSDYLWLLLIILPLWTGLIFVMGGYQEMRTKSYAEVLWILFKANVLALLLFGSVCFMLRLHYVNRSFMVMFLFLSIYLLSLERAALMLSFRLLLRRGYFHRNLLIVGTGRRARAFIHAVRDHAGWGLRVVGLLDQEKKWVGQRVDGAEVIGTMDQIPRILQDRVIDEVVFVVPRDWMTRIEPCVLQCEEAGVRATVAVDLFNLRYAKVHPTDFDGVPLVSFETTPADQWQLAFKRVVDWVAAAGLVLLAPLFAVTALGVRLTSPGPVFFRQTRCGLYGRRFTLYKFRSMVADAEKQKARLEHLNEMKGPIFKITNDPRLTPLGRFLRKTSIDELPQLYNVFRGEMSLVGPRPLIISEVDNMEPWQRRRLSMRPGITGNWQVSGRSGISDFGKWMQLDLEYIDRWSLQMDVLLLLKTIPAVLFARGAK